MFRMDLPDSRIDNDISDLLRDNFGPVEQSCYDANPNDEKFMEDFDRSLPMLVEIFQDLQNAVSTENTESNKSVVNNKTDGKLVDKERANKLENKAKDTSEKTVMDIQSEIELRNEQVRVEKLRKPKFQTLKACEKRAKQEAQWRAAIREAKKATLQCSDSAPAPDMEGESTNNSSYPASSAVKDSSDLSSLDLEPVTVTTPAQTVPIVKSTLMVNTKKHLSSANHFPANSRIFNRSLKQLQCQADAISSAYLSTTASNLARKGQEKQDCKRLNKTTNIKRFLRDGNNNQVKNGKDRKVQSVKTVKQLYNPVKKVNDLVVHGLKNSVKLGNNNSLNQIHRSTDIDSHSSQVLDAFGVATATPVGPVYSSTIPGNNLVPLFPTVVLHPSTPVLPTTAVPRIHHIPETLIRANTTVIQKLPPLLPKPQLLHRARQFRNPVNQFSPSTPTSCYNCQKLSKVLPYLAHSRRKVAMASRRVVKTPMLLLCEVCGCSVRETVIFGDHMQLDHVSSAHFPFFLSNTGHGGLGVVGGSQNYITQGKS